MDAQSLSPDSHETYFRGLAAASYPTPQALASGRMQSRWICRVKKLLPKHEDMKRVGEQIEAQTLRRLLLAHGEHAPESLLQANNARVRLVRCDDCHVVVELEVPSPAMTIGNEALIGTWSALSSVDLMWDIEDLQGVPKKYWRAFDWIEPVV